MLKALKRFGRLVKRGVCTRIKRKLPVSDRIWDESPVAAATSSSPSLSGLVGLPEAVDIAAKTPFLGLAWRTRCHCNLSKPWKLCKFISFPYKDSAALQRLRALAQRILS